MPSMFEEKLVSPYGVVSKVRKARPTIRGLPLLHGASAVASVQPRSGEFVLGVGRSLESIEQAELIATAEAVERYCGGDTVRTEILFASADELGTAALAPQRYPRCSEAEYDMPHCPIQRFDRSARIRWVRGKDLTTQTDVWVPAIMASYDLGLNSAAENFSYRISTGYAIHSDVAEATVGGICEVIERDAIAVLWLQQLRLPHLDASVTSPRIEYLRDWLRRHFMRVLLLDATSDLGVPTVWVLVVADHDDRARHVAGCATGRSLVAAAEKAMIEAIMCRAPLRLDRPIPESFAEFTDVCDGARYMAHPDRAGAFAFLTRGEAQLNVRQVVRNLSADPVEALTELTSIFSARGMPVIVVDRTPAEVAAVGLTCVSVIIPDLQPMSLLPNAQFKAHPRLYDAPSNMGHPVRPESELNPWPVPFA